MLCEPLRHSAGCSEQLVESTMECWVGQCVRDRGLPLRNVDPLSGNLPFSGLLCRCIGVSCSCGESLVERVGLANIELKQIRL